MASDAADPSNVGLENQIGNSYVKSVFPDGPTQNFIPEGVLDRIINRGSIIHYFWGAEDDGAMERERKISAEQIDLVDFILTSGKKVFTTSLISGLKGNELCKAMVYFKNDNFVDGNLPTNDTTCPCFHTSPWSSISRTQFLSSQWKVIVPIFDTEFERLDLEPDRIFPFIHVTGRKQGTFGIVHQVTIHEAHQKEPMRKVSHTFSPSYITIHVLIYIDSCPGKRHLGQCRYQRAQGYLRKGRPTI